MRCAEEKKTRLRFLVVAKKTVITLKPQHGYLGEFNLNWLHWKSARRVEKQARICMHDLTQKIEGSLDVAETFQKSVSCAVIVVDATKIISQFTPDAVALTGVAAETVLNQGIAVLPDALQKILKKTTTGSETISSEIKIVHPTRGALKVLARTARTSDASGKFSGVIVSLYDLSQIEQLEKNLQRIDRLASIGTLSASMAHEIKNALVAVKTFVELLLNRNPQDELAGIVGREITRIDSIVSQMLTFSGPAKPTLSPLHLHDVLNHSLRLVHHQLAKKNIRLERSFAAAPDWVKGDDYQLKQAFLNLLFNALEATPNNGVLTITTHLIDSRPEELEALRETKPTHLRVTIRDSGAGIAPENLARVFEPFFTTKPKGTGLGLPITRRIIQEHRGAISVENQPESGAEFQILFPLPTYSY